MDFRHLGIFVRNIIDEKQREKSEERIAHIGKTTEETRAACRSENFFGT